MIKEQIFSTLDGDATLKSLVTGIYYAFPNDFTAIPVLSYYLVQETPINAFEGEVAVEKVISIDIWSKSAATNDSIALRVKELLSPFMLRDFEGDLFETDTKIHHKNMRFKIIE